MPDLLPRSRLWPLTTALAATVLIAVQYGSTVSLPFVSDDYDFLAHAARGVGEALRFRPQFYHVVPVSLLAFHIIYAASGPDPIAYPSAGLIVHALVTALAGVLAWRLTRRSIVVVVAVALFASSSLPSEVPLWASGLFTSLSTLLYLAGLLAYMDYCARPGRARYALFLVAFTLALLSHEQCVTLIVACMLYRLTMVEQFSGPLRGWLERRRIAGWLREWGPPVALLLAYVTAKLTLTDANLLVNASGLKQTFWSLRIAVLRSLIPNASQGLAAALDDLGRPYLALRLAGWAMLAGLGWLAVRRSRPNRFLLAWLLFHLAVMSYAVSLESRHFYLPLIPAAILVSNALFGLAAGVLGRLPGLGDVWRPRLAAGMLGLFGVAMLGAGSAQIHGRVEVWSAAAGIAQDIARATLAAHAGLPACTAVYMVNLPDSLPAGETDGAYIFRNGIRSALYLAGLPQSVRVHEVHTPDADWTWEVRRGSSEGRITSAEIARLARRPGVLVMRYFPDRCTVARVTSP